MLEVVASINISHLFVRLLCLQTGRRRRYVFDPSARSSIGLFVRSLQTCEHDYVEDEWNSLIQIDLSGPSSIGVKWWASGSGSQTSRSHEAWHRRRGRRVTLDTIGRVAFVVFNECFCTCSFSWVRMTTWKTRLKLSPFSPCLAKKLMTRLRLYVVLSYFLHADYQLIIYVINININ